MELKKKDTLKAVVALSHHMMPLYYFEHTEMKATFQQMVDSFVLHAAAAGFLGDNMGIAGI